jgi:alpha-amylase
MASVCFYFEVHQPYRLRQFDVFQLGKRDYFDDRANYELMRKVARKCYLPANQAMLKLIERHAGRFRVAYSITGVALEQMHSYAPEVLESFQALVDTGAVELLGETYHHSLASLYDKEEFRAQVGMHRDLMASLFDVKPAVFRNTELIYNDDLARGVRDLGFSGVLAEGADDVLLGKSPNHVYGAADTQLALLLKNHRLSDDIAFRFSNQGWENFPLTAAKFARWIHEGHDQADTVNLFMDYETFGEHQWEDTGIFHFLDSMPGEVLKHPDNRFVTPSEAIGTHDAKGEFDAPHYISWADMERDLSAWLSNPIQYDALRAVYDLEGEVRRCRDENILEDWRRLQTSDHFYYMCTKWFQDGDVHAYFNPYESPYEAFIAYMNAIADMRLRIENAPKHTWWSSSVHNLKSFLIGNGILRT